MTVTFLFYFIHYSDHFNTADISDYETNICTYVALTKSCRDNWIWLLKTSLCTDV